MASLSNLPLASIWEKEHINGLKNGDNCSGFIHSLLSEAGIPVPSNLNADGLIDYFESSSAFESLGKGITALEAAYAQAEKDKIVIVGAKSGDLGQANGHVAIVKGQGGKENPFIYGGASNSAAKSQGDKRLSLVIRRSSWGEIRFFSVK